MIPIVLINFLLYKKEEGKNGMGSKQEIWREREKERCRLRE
jgi:hypothetical protein